MQALIVAIAILFGFAIGYWTRNAQAKSQKSLEDELDQKAKDDLLVARNELSAVKTRLDEKQAECNRLAGFESLATERGNGIMQLTADMTDLRKDISDKASKETESAARIKELEIQLKAEQDIIPSKIALLETAQTALSSHFELLAGKVLDQKSNKIAESNKAQIGEIVESLKGQIKEFGDKVGEAQKESFVGRTQLSAELNQLRGLNQKLADEANALSRALTRDTREQGHWGELVLLDILEACDLKRGLHYTYHETFVMDGDDGSSSDRKITDVILRFPEGRSLVIDSKVTLIAHKEYVDASEESDRKDALTRLVGSFRNHMKGLASKNYQELVGEKSPDYVVLFAPNEAAYLLAIQFDPKLITDGYKSRVLIAGPTTILHIARIVESLWRNDDRAKSLKQIAERARLLYEEFTRFVDALEGVRTSLMKAAAGIQSAEQSHEEAMKRLTRGRGNLVSQAKELGRLGNKSAKEIAPRVLEITEEEEGEDAREPELLLATQNEKGNDFDRADVDQAELALAAEADDTGKGPSYGNE